MPLFVPPSDIAYDQSTWDAVVNVAPSKNAVRDKIELLDAAKLDKTSFTQGSVLFRGSSEITQDNTNFFWDDTNDRLGISTSVPASKLDLLPTATFGAAGVSGITNRAHTVTLSGANPTTYATQHVELIAAMTLVGTNAGQTVTNAAGLSVVPPVKSTNVALTNTHGILIPAQAVSTATNAYGMTVNAPTGATNNYLAQFAGTGNIGIGTSAPKDKIVMFSTTNAALTHCVAVGGAGDTQQAIIQLATKHDGTSVFGVNTNTFGWQLYANSNSYTGGTNELGLAYWDGGAYTVARRTLPDGKLGLGNVTPTSPLHIYDSNTQTAVPQLYIEQDGTGDAALELGIVGDSYIIGIDNSDADNFKISYSGTQGSGVLGTNDRVVIGATGLVGIGGSAATYKLEVISGDISASTAGNGLRVKEGTNARMGATALVAGTIVVNTTAVTANSRIFLTSNVDGGVPGTGVRVSARTAGTSFTITSLNVGDTSTVAWLIMEPS